jgi:DNA polymerase III epsilon subunit-like protein
LSIANIIDSPRTATCPEDSEDRRPAVLVFHDSSQDIKYLKKLDYNVYTTGDLLEILDTRDMAQFVSRTTQPTKLASILDFLQLPYRNLHNAGNDAVYTMQAMIGLAIKRRQQSLEDARTKKNPR